MIFQKPVQIDGLVGLAYFDATNPPACRRVLWILLVRSCTVCLVFCLCLDFPLARIFAPSNLNPPSPPPPLPQFQPKPRLRNTIFSVFSSYFSSVSFVAMCWVRLCPRLAHRARVLVCSTASCASRSWLASWLAVV